MASALLYDRLQFAVTATFHYLFQQLTMELALLLFYLKSRALRTGDAHFQDAARSASNSRYGRRMNEQHGRLAWSRDRANRR
jgi:cytochrome bd-type quinol oxidase subunit 1